MRYATVPGRTPSQIAGLSFAALVHVILVYALLTNLAHRSVPPSLAPLEVRSIRETPPPTPPATKTVRPKTSFWDPSRVVVPPPVVDILLPPDPGKTVTVSTDGPRTEDGAPTQVASTSPEHRSVAGNCSNARDAAASVGYPAKARRQGLESGDVTVNFNVNAAGAVSIETMKSSQRAFEESAASVVTGLHCNPGSYQMQIGFKLN